MNIAKSAMLFFGLSYFTLVFGAVADWNEEVPRLGGSALSIGLLHGFPIALTAITKSRLAVACVSALMVMLAFAAGNVNYVVFDLFFIGLAFLICWSACGKNKLEVKNTLLDQLRKDIAESTAADCHPNKDKARERTFRSEFTRAYGEAKKQQQARTSKKVDELVQRVITIKGLQLTPEERKAMAENILEKIQKDGR